MCEIREKPFLPQVCNKRFVYVLCFSCSFCQLFANFLPLSSTRPVFTNRRTNIPSFNWSAYVESKLHKPQQQCFVAPFLQVISPIMFSLSTILLVESAVCCYFTDMFVRTLIPSGIFRVTLRLCNESFLDQKRRAIENNRLNQEVPFLTRLSNHFKCRIFSNKDPRRLLSFQALKCFLFYARLLSEEMW